MIVSGKHVVFNKFLSRSLPPRCSNHFIVVLRGVVDCDQPIRRSMEQDQLAIAGPELAQIRIYRIYQVGKVVQPARVQLRIHKIRLPVREKRALVKTNARCKCNQLLPVAVSLL